MLLIFALLTLSTSALHANSYPPLNITDTAVRQDDGHSHGPYQVLPFCTAYPLKGDLTIIGRKMQAGSENYLRAFHHFIEGTSHTAQKNNVVFHHIYNASDPSDAGMEELKTTLAQNPLLMGCIGHETFLSLTPLIEKKK